MWSNPQFPADIVTFTEEIFNEKLHFLCSVWFSNYWIESEHKYTSLNGQKLGRLKDGEQLFKIKK